MAVYIHYVKVIGMYKSRTMFTPVINIIFIVDDGLNFFVNCFVFVFIRDLLSPMSQPL